MKYIILPALLALAACSTPSYPLVGVYASGARTFTGTAHEPIVGAGGMEVTLANGTQCQGHYVEKFPKDGIVYGSGDFSCVDGQTGTFSFTGSTRNGTGNGVMGMVGMTNGSQPFTILFGSQVNGQVSATVR